MTGINVISASRFAGEAGPIEHDASARAITGRAGLYPSRYQSDEVDHADGSLVRQSSRKLRGHGVERESILYKLREFHRVHKSPLEASIADLTATIAWLPKSIYTEEAKPLQALAGKRHRGV